MPSWDSDDLVLGSLQSMFRATWTPEQGWQGALEPYQCLQLEPAAQVLNYGQSIFEGLKAQRSAKGRIVLFRPQENAARLAQGYLSRCQEKIDALIVNIVMLGIVDGPSCMLDVCANAAWPKLR